MGGGGRLTLRAFSRCSAAKCRRRRRRLSLSGSSAGSAAAGGGRAGEVGESGAGPAAFCGPAFFFFRRASHATAFTCFGSANGAGRALPEAAAAAANPRSRASSGPPGSGPLAKAGGTTGG